MLDLIVASSDGAGGRQRQRRRDRQRKRSDSRHHDFRSRVQCFAPLAGIDPWSVWATFKRSLTMRRPAYVEQVNLRRRCDGINGATSERSTRNNPGLQRKILPYLVGLSVALVTLTATILTFVLRAMRVRSICPRPADCAVASPSAARHRDVAWQPGCRRPFGAWPQTVRRLAAGHASAHPAGQGGCARDERRWIAGARAGRNFRPAGWAPRL
jgi:hypothetical protein